MCNVLHGYNAYHVQVAQQMSAQGQPLNVSRCDFRGVGKLLQGVNFAGVQASGVLFSPCDSSQQIAGIICKAGQLSDLTGVNFTGTNLISASFKNTILKGANFTGADIAYADFSGADLTGAKIDGALNVQTAIFCNAIMPDGVRCKTGSWKSKSGKVFNCGCHQK